MESRNDKYSLKLLILELVDKFKNINTIYIFGSRRYKTRSTRSDVDLLLVTDHYVIPEDVRDFALHKCSALDFFFLEKGSARSCANGSVVRGKSQKDLINSLGAIKIWDKKNDFLPADIDWDFEVIKGLNPCFTTLVSALPFPSKAENITSQEYKKSKTSKFESLKELVTSPLAIILSVIIGSSAITFSIINQVLIRPLQIENSRLSNNQESNKNIIELEPEALRLLKYFYTLQTKYDLHKMIISKEGLLSKTTNNIYEDINIIQDFFKIHEIEDSNIRALEKLIYKIPEEYLKNIPETRLGSPYVLSVTTNGIAYINMSKK